ncbi:MAG: DUF2946 family protein [Bacteroidota bacterium]
MLILRPLSASALLAVAVLGAVVAPAVHWASHGLEDHEDHEDHHHAVGHGDDDEEVAEGASHAGEPEEDAHHGECPSCAHLQQTLGSEAPSRPFYAFVVGLERSASPPAAPTAHTDVVTPEERGPPARA